jgi:choline kinase
VTIQAVILAAGYGSRLRPLTEARPKALVPFGARPIIGHALDALGASGIDDVVVVVGHARQALAAYLAAHGQARIRVVPNPDYASTNTLASLVCAAPLIEGAFLLLDGDVLFEPAVLAPLLGDGTRLAVDRDRPLDDDAVKVATEADRIAAVGKTLPPGRRPVGESIGIAKIDEATARALLPLCADVLGDGGRTAYYEAAFQQLIERGGRFLAADVTGLRWVEIDDHDDLRRAETLFVAA